MLVIEDYHEILRFKMALPRGASRLGEYPHLLDIVNIVSYQLLIFKEFHGLNSLI